MNSLNMDSENRVVLNVGGIRHETYKVFIFIKWIVSSNNDVMTFEFMFYRQH